MAARTCAFNCGDSRSTCEAFDGASRLRSGGSTGTEASAAPKMKMARTSTRPSYYRSKPSARLLDEAMLHRVVDEVHVGVQVQLLQDASAVRAHRGGRQAHLLGDLVQRLAGREEPHHAVFAIREAL